jgi:hypothetical protein
MGSISPVATKAAEEASKAAFSRTLGDFRDCAQNY